MDDPIPSSTPYQGLSGQWSGTSQLWLVPGADAHQSGTTARFSSVAQGQFLIIAYTVEGVEVVPVELGYYDGRPVDEKSQLIYTCVPAW